MTGIKLYPFLATGRNGYRSWISCKPTETFSSAEWLVIWEPALLAANLQGTWEASHVTCKVVYGGCNVVYVMLFYYYIFDSLVYAHSFYNAVCSMSCWRVCGTNRFANVFLQACPATCDKNRRGSAWKPTFTNLPKTKFAHIRPWYHFNGHICKR